MPRQIVNRDLVFSAADALLIEGEEPSLILIKERIGGGSYSTIKPHLDAWNDQRKAQQIIVPEDILQLGREFMHKLWSAALIHDDGRIAQVRLDAQHQVDDVTIKLFNAEQMIEHLERDNEERQHQIGEANTTIEVLHMQLADSQAALESVRAELAQTHTAAQVAEVRAATLDRQVNSLQIELAEVYRQREIAVSDAMATIQRQLADLTNHMQNDNRTAKLTPPAPDA